MVKPFELKTANLELWRRWNSKIFFNHGEAYLAKKRHSKALEKVEFKHFFIHDEAF